MGGNGRAPENWAQMCGVVLEYIETQGSFRGLLVPNQGKQKLVITAIEEGLIVWDKTLGKYDLTAAGRARLVEYRHKIATAT
jgi:hypothetical protein